jgi:hypothetical protein
MSKLIVNQLQPYSGSLITFVDSTNVTVGGDLSATNLGGTLSTAAQTNITSLGTLSSLAVSGNLTVDTDTLFVDAASNEVGIGTSSPSYKLDVNGSINISDANFFRYKGDKGIIGSATSITGEAGAFDKLGIRAANDILFATGGANERMRIDSSGNVGIGTATPAAKLHLQTPAGTAPKIYFGQDATSAWSVGSPASTDALVFINEQFAERMRITSGGDVSITSGNLSFANGNGIDFSASAGGGASSSLLDDYEEGTWTPDVIGEVSGSVTYTTQNGTYVKVGQMVTAQFIIEFDKNTATGGNAAVTLPFTVNSATNNYPIAAVLIDNLIAETNPILQGNPNGASANILDGNGGTGGHTLLTYSELDTGSRAFRGTITYRSA